jgi:putative transposase
MNLSFKYRLYPTSSQVKKLDKCLYLNRLLYNCALQERISHYKTFKTGIYYSKQASYLKEIKELFPEYNDCVYSQVSQATLKRLDKTYNHFFNKSGFPRFKSENRFRSFTYPQSGFKLENNKVFLSKIGHIPMVFHRNIKGKIKTCQVIKTYTDKWYVVFSCEEVPLEPLRKTGKDIGVDVGIKTYIKLSDGEAIGNPKYLKNSLDKLSKAQRKLSKLSMRDSRRPEAKRKVARIHEKVKNQRDDFQHKVSKKLVEKYDTIFVEDLKVKNMVSYRNLNRAIRDCAWSKLIDKIVYKAERADKQLIKVDPRNTSKMCSSCGKIVPKDLSDRIHICECGLEMDRDLNAAINIFNRGMLCIPRKSGTTLFEISRSPPPLGGGVVTYYVYFRLALSQLCSLNI